MNSTSNSNNDSENDNKNDNNDDDNNKKQLYDNCHTSVKKEKGRERER